MAANSKLFRNAERQPYSAVPPHAQVMFPIFIYVRCKQDHSSSIGGRKSPVTAPCGTPTVAVLPLFSQLSNNLPTSLKLVGFVKNRSKLQMISARHGDGHSKHTQM